MKRLIVVCLLLAGCLVSGPLPTSSGAARALVMATWRLPRAAVIDTEGRLWVVDFTARVQAFSLDGEYQGITFTTPDYRKGRPSGRASTAKATSLSATLTTTASASTTGTARNFAGFHSPGEESRARSAYVSDVVQDEDGYWYVAEFGECSGSAN